MTAGEAAHEAAAQFARDSARAQGSGRAKKSHAAAYMKGFLDFENFILESCKSTPDHPDYAMVMRWYDGDACVRSRKPAARVCSSSASSSSTCAAISCSARYHVAYVPKVPMLLTWEGRSMMTSRVRARCCSCGVPRICRPRQLAACINLGDREVGEAALDPSALVDGADLWTNACTTLRRGEFDPAIGEVVHTRELHLVLGVCPLHLVRRGSRGR